MRHFKCSYGYDVSCYADFRIFAKSWKDAERKLDEMLKAGCFDNVSGEPDWESTDNARVFVSSRIASKADLQWDDPVEALEGFMPLRKPRKTKRALFASLPVKGPPCLKCDEQYMQATGRYWRCPKCGDKRRRDFGV